MKNKEEQEHKVEETKQTEEKDPVLENEKLDKEKNKQEIDSEVLDQIVKELEERYNVKKENIQIVKVDKVPSKTKLWQSILRHFLFFVLDFLLIISLQGFLEFTETKLLDLFLFSLVFFILDFVFRVIIGKYFRKYILYSFGTIMIPTTIIALIVAQVVIDLKINNSNNLIAFYILFLIVRSVLRSVLMRKEIKSMMRGRRK